MKKNIITLIGYDEITRLFSELKKEKEHWVEEKRIAAEQGDRSENAEYIAAKENIRRIDKELFRLNKTIQNCSAVDTTKRKKTSIVLFGSVVKIKNFESDEEFFIRIVGTYELIYTQKVVDELCISNISPLGSKILRKEVGDEIDVNHITYEVLDILA